MKAVGHVMRAALTVAHFFAPGAVRLGGALTSLAARIEEAQLRLAIFSILDD